MVWFFSWLLVVSKFKLGSFWSIKLIYTFASKSQSIRALIDCDLLAKVYINLIDQKEPSLNFETTNNQEKNQTNENKIKYYKKVIYPSKLETKNHQKYLKEHLKKNFF